MFYSLNNGYSLFDVFGRDLHDGDLVIQKFYPDIYNIVLLSNNTLYMYNQESGTFVENTDECSCSSSNNSYYVYKLDGYGCVYKLGSNETSAIQSLLNSLSEPAKLGDFVFISLDGFESGCASTYAVCIGDSEYYTGTTILKDNNLAYIYKVHFLSSEEESIKSNLLSSYQSFVIDDIRYKEKGVLCPGDAFVKDKYFYFCLDKGLYIKLSLLGYYKYKKDREYVKKIYTNIVTNHYSNQLLLDYINYGEYNDLSERIAILFSVSLPSDVYYSGHYKVSLSDELKNRIARFDERLKESLLAKYNSFISAGFFSLSDLLE